MSDRLRWGRVAGPLLTFLGGGLLAAGAGEGWFAAAGGAGLIIVLETKAFFVRRRRAWIEILPDGFIHTDRTGTREFRDYEIISAACYTLTIYNNGVATGEQRIARLWPVKSAVIHLDSFIKLREADPMHELLRRIIALLQDGFARAVAHGVEIGGDEWRLNQRELRVGSGARERRIPLSEIAAAEAADGMMCVWTRGEELPAVRLPLIGPNVGFLPDLLAPYLSPTRLEKPSAGLGRVLFTRTPSMGWFWLYTSGGLCFAALGVWLAIDDFSLVALSLMLLLPGLGLFLAAANVWRMKFRGCERGVSQSGLFRSCRLRFEDVAWFSYGAVREYHDGTYQGTRLTLDFIPFRGAGRRITLHASSQGDDAELDRLRDAVAQVLGDRLFAKWAAGETAVWTPNLSVSADELIYRSPGLLVRNAEARISLREFGRLTIDNGVASFFTKHATKPFTTESAAAANFYPGLQMFQRVLQHSFGNSSPGQFAEESPQ